ncbi:MAG TPA: hypothetical protein VE244_09150 [Nitrososphaeraceae archaeon]|jgi:hypothetical protein|nr:hypothetical protein [Nitrososphaeraceae archaeon]
MNERDINVFQNKLISNIIDRPSRNTKALVDKYKTKGFLTQSELSKLIAIKLREDYEKEIDSWRFDKTAYLPRGWSRIKCKVCNEAELGVILNPSFGIGKYIFEQFKDHLCNECRKVEFTWSS